MAMKVLSQKLSLETILPSYETIDDEYAADISLLFSYAPEVSQCSLASLVPAHSM